MSAIKKLSSVLDSITKDATIMTSIITILLLRKKDLIKHNQNVNTEVSKLNFCTCYLNAILILYKSSFSTFSLLIYGTLYLTNWWACKREKPIFKHQR